MQWTGQNKDVDVGKDALGPCAEIVDMGAFMAINPCPIPIRILNCPFSFLGIDLSDYLLGLAPGQY